MAKTGGGGLKSGLRQNGTGKPVSLSGWLGFFRLYLNFPLGDVSDPPGISPGLIMWLCEERKFALSSQAISKWIEISYSLKFIMSPKDRELPPPPPPQMESVSRSIDFRALPSPQISYLFEDVAEHINLL